MPGKQLVGGELYRYAFQGQEKDPETGKEAFELRLWDGRIGRWLSPDPYGQFFSPYLGMGNNPISLVDPDGGCVGPDCIEGSAGTIGTDQNGYEWTWDGDAWGTNFTIGLNEVMISGKGNGLSGVASVRFEQWKQIEPEFIRSRNEFGKGAFGIALSPFAIIGALELAPVIASNISTFGSSTAVFSGEATVAGTESLYTYQTIFQAGKAGQGIYNIATGASSVTGQFAGVPVTYIAGRGAVPILANVYSRGAPFFQTHGIAFIKYLATAAAGGYLSWEIFVDTNNNHKTDPEEVQKFINK